MKEQKKVVEADLMEAGVEGAKVEAPFHLMSMAVSMVL
jgi:hypothetical protein